MIRRFNLAGNGAGDDVPLLPVFRNRKQAPATRRPRRAAISYLAGGPFYHSHCGGMAQPAPAMWLRGSLLKLYA
jgi:hypothetical protein